MRRAVLGACGWVLVCLPWCAAQKSAAAKLDARQVRALVQQLNDDDFDVREKAEESLRRGGAKVVPLLEKELARKPPLEARRRLENLVAELTKDSPKRKQAALDARIQTLVPKLGDDAFDVREKTTAVLAGMGRPALPALRKAFKASADLEVRVRLQRIIRRIERGR
jgi:hypothetical protein